MTENVVNLGVIRQTKDKRFAMDEEDKEAARMVLNSMLERLNKDELSSLLIIGPMSDHAQMLFAHVGVHNDVYRAVGGLDSMRDQIIYEFHTYPMMHYGEDE